MTVYGRPPGSASVLLIIQLFRQPAPLDRPYASGFSSPLSFSGTSWRGLENPFKRCVTSYNHGFCLNDKNVRFVHHLLI